QLLEDCGRLPLRDAVATLSGPERWSLHIEACDWVARLQAVPREAGVEAFGRRLDATLLAYKADLVIEHGLTARGRATTSAEAEVVRAAFSEIEAAVQEAPSRLAHRDYQSANLLVDPAAPAGQRLRMIDLQGAFLAPPEYDLVCLLCDSYIEIPEETIVSLREAIRPKLPDAPDPDECARRFDLLTLSRKGKDHARFLYAARQRGDTRFLDWVPYTVRLLQRAAQRLAPTHPALASYAELVHALPESPCAP
ncbi:MAG: phosphotransferase, partial [Myxococcota bacterium]